MRNRKGTLTSPPPIPKASILRKGGAHRPWSSAASGGEARYSAQSVFLSLPAGWSPAYGTERFGRPHSGVESHRGR